MPALQQPVPAGLGETRDDDGVTGQKKTLSHQIPGRPPDPLEVRFLARIQGLYTWPGISTRGPLRFRPGEGDEGAREVRELVASACISDPEVPRRVGRQRYSELPPANASDFIPEAVDLRDLGGEGRTRLPAAPGR